MKITLTASALLAAAVIPAQAADFGPYAPESPAYVDHYCDVHVFDWMGQCVGNRTGGGPTRR